MRSGAVAVGSNIQTVIDMVVDELPLRFVDRLLDSMQLLSKLEAAPTFSEHRYDASHVALSTLEALDDVWMRLMDMCVCHVSSISYGGGYAKRVSAACSKPTGLGVFLQCIKAVILYPRILLPRMRSASAPEIFSKRRNAVVAGPGNDPDQKVTISKLHCFSARNSPTARASAGTAGVRHAARFGRTPSCEFAEPAFGNRPLNRPG